MLDVLALTLGFALLPSITQVFDELAPVLGFNSFPSHTHVFDDEAPVLGLISFPERSQVFEEDAPTLGQAGRQQASLPIPALKRQGHSSFVLDEACWLEAALRYQGKAVSFAALQSLPVIYPFVLTQPLGYLMANSPMLEVRSEGPSNQLVALREAI